MPCNNGVCTMPAPTQDLTTSQKLKNALMGSPAETMQFQRFTPAQQDLQNQSIQQLLSLLRNNQSGMNQFNFSPIAENMRRNFATRTAPMLAERFVGFGQNKRSGPLESALAGAGQALESDIGSLESKYNLAAGGQQAQLQNQLMQLLLSIGMQPSFESAYRPSQPGFLQGLAGGAGNALGGLGSLLPLKLLGLF